MKSFVHQQQGGRLQQMALQKQRVAALASLGVLTTEGGVFDAGSVALLNTNIAAQNANNTALNNPALVQYVSIPLTLAQLIASNTVPIPLLPAQGGGTLIEVISMMLDLIRGSAAFVGGGAVGAYLGADATGVLASATFAATVFTTFAASHCALVAGALAVSASTAVLNTGLVLANPTADFTVGTGASGILKLAYRVHSGLS